ncbi:MAG: T9SS type A sorting domain-containing protein [Bacteroidales bacterium]|nr:T9SS type A sorting domain-containing protein [Bacteroidales bacterium]
MTYQITDAIDNEIDVSSLSAGVYMLVAETREGRYARKFIKK